MNKITTIFGKAFSHISEDGIGTFIRNSSSMLWRKLFLDAEHLYFLSAQEIQHMPVAMPAGVEVLHFQDRQELPPAFLESMRGQIRKKWMSNEVVDRYLRGMLDQFGHGGEMWLAVCEGKYAGYIWTISSSGEYQRHFNLFPLTNNDCLLFAGYVFPDHRGKGLLPLLLKVASQRLASDGIQRFFATIKVWNRASINGTSKAGMRRIATARPFIIFGRVLIFWRKGYTDATPL